MKVKSNVKAGGGDGTDGIKLNHSQKVKGLRIKSGVKAGDTGNDYDFGVKLNHNQTVRR